MTTKKQIPQKDKKKRVRAKFRPTFKERCVYSFSECGDSLARLKNLSARGSDNSIVGMQILNAYKFLSHSIEMLCKATLHQKSRYLTLTDLAYFDELWPEGKVFDNAKTCGARVALARASKLFRRSPFTSEDLGRLEKIITVRNAIEHGEFFTKDFKNDIHTLVTAMEVVTETYDNQFREGNLVASCVKFSEDFDVNYTKAVEENSKEFKELIEKAKRLAKKSKFVHCESCLYNFAKLSKNEKEYECLWCGDKRVKKICIEDSCKREFWDSVDSKETSCGSSHNFIYKFKVNSNLKWPVVSPLAVKGTESIDLTSKFWQDLHSVAHDSGTVWRNKYVETNPRSDDQEPEKKKDDKKKESDKS